jgi:hypothetical protein
VIIGAKLVSRKVKRKRSKALIIMLLPALIFIGVIGWDMYSIDNRKPKPTHRRPVEKDNVTLLPIVFEEQQEKKSI